MIRTLVLLLVTVISFGSCSRENKEFNRIKIANQENYEFCLDYNFSQDSLQISSFTIKKDTTKVSLFRGVSEEGILLGGLLFNGNKCLFQYYALYNSNMDTLNLNIEGTYSSDLLYIDGENELGGSEFISFFQVNNITIQSDSIPEFKIENIQHRIECNIFPMPSHRIFFEKDGNEIEATFQRFQ